MLKVYASVLVGVTVAQFIKKFKKNLILPSSCLIVTKLCVCFRKGVFKSSKVKEWYISSESVSMQEKFVISAIYSYLIPGLFIDRTTISFAITLIFYLRSEHFPRLIGVKRIFVFIQIV